jgi:membrane protease YdiL (CAAX protease family)
MATLTTARPAPGLSLKQLIIRYPLISYFILAFAGAWLFIAPIMVSQRGLGLITVPEPMLLALFLLSTFAGPTPAAFIVTGITEGKAGMRQLLHRMMQWRVGIKWYLLVLIGYPLIFLVGALVLFGPSSVDGLATNWPLLLTAYLPVIPIGLIYPAIGEEPGWRGFALPRLQYRYGPVLGSLILGTLHAIWHLPAYFIPGAISDGGFNPTVFVSNSLAIIAFTLLWTWLFNSAGGSVFFAMFVHATSNANSGLMSQLLNVPGDNPFFGFAVTAVLALLVIIGTRGRLAYRREQPAALVATPAAA